MSYVVDASVAVKWLVVEDDFENAMALLRSRAELLAPRLIVSELANALWKKVRLGDLTPAIAIERLGLVGGYFSRIVDDVDMQATLDLAIQLDHPAYDCIYIEVARTYGAALITADKRLRRAANGLSGFTCFDLSEWSDSRTA